jgi:hypothetical protein
VKTIIVLMAVLLVTGCTRSIIMRHPDGRETECGSFDKSRERQCVDDFRRQGYERQP